ncbi:MAG: prenyltransferase/squalene oxidase repeat-containing protein [Phycisphaerae bacterium]
MSRNVTLSVSTITLLGTVVVLSAPYPAAGRSVVESGPTWVPAVEPKPLSDNVKQGLAWLVGTQLPSGGWGQGEESSNMGTARSNLKDMPNVADTCTATLALIRAGSTPAQGTHAANIRKGVDFVCGQIEESDPVSLYVTPLRNTRLQMKLGTYIDTFVAAMLLSEVKDRMPDENGNLRVEAALNKVMEKIEKNQKDDGSWENRGWAPALAQAMASKAINRAAQAGAPVDEQVREKAEIFARLKFDGKSRSFGLKGSAGVELYAYAANLGAMQDSDNTNTAMLLDVQAQIAGAKSEEERTQAEQTLKRFREAKSELSNARQAVIRKLDNPQFVSGFGSNGGEEFLSYMNIGESLVVKGGPEWEKWDKSITQNLNRIQNPGGSWSGHHCITGRSFCTATALLVLTVDRAPVRLAAKIRRQ